ncbi:MAG: hypothetical protein GAK30_01646 [Paracidovorax wautersii]|uniref:Uncharacterized protein n=1 Tax=Paracidovorax wautersii TaxID=1177982 RepID=A0A7V8FPK6_9BURK|nr:MAG: hypothetical protein GAK30_01646 [Paracidovorax wautersii]
MESLTALVEHMDGRLEIVRWPMMHAPRKRQPQPAEAEDPLHILDDLVLPAVPTR